MKATVLFLVLHLPFWAISQSKEQTRTAEWYMQYERDRAARSQNSSILWDLFIAPSYSEPIKSPLKTSSFDNAYIAGQLDRNGKLNGVGIEMWDDGTYFTGQFENDEPKGLGIYYGKTAAILGDWRNLDGKNLTEGFSAIFWKEKGVISFGVTKKGTRNGLNITQCPIGCGDDKYMKYVGEYRDDLRNGYGIKYYADGSHRSGIWEGDVLVKEIDRFIVLEYLGF